MIYNFSILLLIFSTFVCSAFSQSLIWQDHPSNGSQYALTHSPMTWTDAESFAQSVEGHLATINSQSENDWVFENFKDEWFGIIEVGEQGEIGGSFGEYAWIGFNDLDNNSTYQWSSGQITNFTNWRSGEPNGITVDDFGSENVAALNGSLSGQWDDIPATVKILGIIERPQQISTPTPTITPVPSSANPFL